MSVVRKRLKFATSFSPICNYGIYTQNWVCGMFQKCLLHDPIHQRSVLFYKYNLIGWQTARMIKCSPLLRHIPFTGHIVKGSGLILNISLSTIYLRKIWKEVHVHVFQIHFILARACCQILILHNVFACSTNI